MGLYKRPRSPFYWCSFVYEDKRYQVSTRETDKVLAGRFLREREKTGPEKVAGAPETLTLGAYLDDWIAGRRRAGVRGVRDEQRAIDDHVRPLLGHLALADVTRTQVVELVMGLQEKVSERTGAPYSARYVLGIYNTLRLAYGDAVDNRIVIGTPCTLRTKRGELPPKRDKDPTWRQRAVYSQTEIEQLLFSPEIPDDRRMLYSLQALAGLRGNEAIGRRWRDYDATARPLGRLTVATQADGAHGDRETKTGDVRHVPIVPLLAGMLADWRQRGFPMLFGRAPTDDDPIVPSRNDLAGASSFRSGSNAYERLVEDLERAGLRRVPSARHSMRATFLTLLEESGANMAIARAATHRAAPGDAMAGYLRSASTTRWARLCDEVAKLPVRRSHPSASVVSIGDTRRDTGSETTVFQQETMGVAGLEATQPLRTSGNLAPHAVARTRGGPKKAHGSALAVAVSPSVTDPAVEQLRALGFHDAADALERAAKGGAGA
jgi:integrase